MTQKILVVDDEEHIVNLLVKALDTKDTEAKGVLSAEDAMTYVKNNDVDLVITDISMPGMQGTELFFKLKEQNPFIQVIMMTAYPTLENITMMLEGGAGDFLIKPFEINQVRKVVNENFARIGRWKNLRKEWLQYKQSGDKNHG
ncbi:MAG: response regulator [Candidatus Omnitrophica bacterium]|nr:response regulator [Candidatus Omnitrophota bacterium]